MTEDVVCPLEEPWWTMVLHWSSPECLVTQSQVLALGRYIWVTSKVSSHIRSLIIGTEMVPEMVYFDHLTQLMAQEDCIKFVMAYEILAEVVKTVEAWMQCRDGPCGICGRWSGISGSFPQGTLVFPTSHHYTEHVLKISVLSWCFEYPSVWWLCISVIWEQH